MKATFIFGLAAGLAAISGCIGFDPPDADGGATSGCGEDCVPSEHGLSGEMILFVNTRLSDTSTYQSHLPLDGAGTYLGNAVYLYDPTRECEDGGNACRVAVLGHLRLDETLGELSVEDNSLRKFEIRDLAWHPEHGLWAATFDIPNDEWSICRLTVDDWTMTANLIGVERWVIPPGPAESPDTDPCYWFESVSGLGFIGDNLTLGVRGAGSKGLLTDGSLLRVDREVFDQGHCVYPSDISHDPDYYACANVCQEWCTFGQHVGVAGDVIAAADGEGASAWLRSEDDTVMPLGRNEMSSCAMPEPGELSVGMPDNVFMDNVVRGDEIDGLARVGEKLYGLSVLGKVYEIDEEQRIVTQIDDLAPLFPEQGLRLRGATEITVASP